MEFGEKMSPFAPDSPIMDTFLKTTSSDDFTNQLIFLEDYDKYYGIYDPAAHDAQDPMAIIGYNAAEDPITNSPLERFLHELITCKLPELLNTPVMELARWPRWALEPYLEEGRKSRERDVKARKELEELEAQAKQAQANNDIGRMP